MARNQYEFALALGRFHLALSGRTVFHVRSSLWGLRAPPLFAKGRLVRPFAFLTRPSRRVFLLAKAR